MQWFDIGIKILEIIVLPGIYLFYKEVRSISRTLAALKIEIVRLVPIDRFIELDKKVSILETSYRDAIHRIEADLFEIKDALKEMRKRK